MEKETRKLEFYGGEWISLLPIVLFIVGIAVTTFIWGSISDGALWVPIFLALVISFFLAKDKRHYSECLIEGMGSKDVAFPICTWLFAGVFSRILRMSGFAAGLAGLANSFGVGPVTFTVISFIAATLFSTATGTGFGTIAACMGVLYPAGVELGVHPAFLAGAILGGAAFGDNLAPVSDSTIASATAMGVDIPKCVKSRLKYSLTAAALTLVAIIVVGNILAQGNASHVASDYNKLTLIMLIPVAITLFIAIKTGDLIIATVIGSVLAGAFAVAFGLMDFLQIDAANPTKDALFSVSGSGLDREVGGAVFKGLSSMTQMVVLCLMLFSAIHIMKCGHGDRRILKALGRVARTAQGAETVVSFMVIILSAVMGLNAPAILTVGPSFARPLADEHGISRYRMANLMDAQSCTWCYSLPWTCTRMYILSFTVDSAAPLSGIEIFKYCFFTFAMTIVMFVTIFTGIGRKDFMEESNEVVKAEQK